MTTQAVYKLQEVLLGEETLSKLDEETSLLVALLSLDMNEDEVVAIELSEDIMLLSLDMKDSEELDIMELSKELALLHDEEPELYSSAKADVVAGVACKEAPITAAIRNKKQNLRVGIETKGKWARRVADL